MDIHPPHPIHTWKDFGIQLVTITAGILIALSLEGVRESIHDRAIVREARENIRREIAGMADRGKKVTAIGIVTGSDAANPDQAPPEEIQRFREQIISLRSILFLEEQWAHGASERYKKALE